jgi:DNA-binding CsgD family transcriptional regulator
MPIWGKSGENEEFVGRTAERNLLGQLAAETASGRSWAVLIDGEVGIGKTALLRSAAASLRSFRVLRVWCDPAEAGLPFGLISQLLWRARRQADLSVPAADLMTAQGSPARVGAYLLDQVLVAQAAHPVALVIDDLQWADRASAETLSYVLRRLAAARVLTLLSARTGADSAAAWSGGPADDWRRLIDDREFGRRLSLRGMTAEEVAELARHLGHAAVPLPVAERLRRHTDGNPAYLRALLTDLSPDYLSSSNHPLPVRGPAAVQVGRLLSALPERSLRLLTALAVLDAKCRLATVAQVGGVADPVSALEPLLESGIVQWWPEEPATPVRVRLPVQRDAIYQMLTPRRRRELHLATAAVVRGDEAWMHRVAAANGPDQNLVRDLEQAAGVLFGQGATERGATLMLWAADLSTDHPEYERRLLIGVVNLIWCDCFCRAEALRPQVVDCAPGPLRDLILAALDPGDAPLPSVRALLTQALKLTAAGQSQATARAVLAVVRRYAWRSGDGAGGDGPGSDGLEGDGLEGEFAGRVLTMDGIDPEARQLAECLAGEAAGRRRGGARAVLRALEQLSPAPLIAAAPADAILLWRRGTWRAAVGDLAAASDDLSAALQFTGTAAVTAVDASANVLLSYVEYLLGEWNLAAVAAEQAAALALSRGTTWSYSQVYALSACVAASRGNWVQATEQLRTSQQWSRRSGPSSAAIYPALAGATLAQARGDHAGMLTALRPLLAQPPASGDRQHYQCGWRPLHVEALIAVGRLEEASAALAELGALAEGAEGLQAGFGWLSGWLAYRDGQPRLARARYEEALSRPASADDVPLLRARLEDAYGQLLLAQRNRRPAITWLRRAYGHYAALGASPFQERCAAELVASGFRTAEPGSAAQRAVLSGREHRVAHLVTQGLTNQEVAKELYVTTKTVEYHLSNIFTKLGITSRRQLRSLFPDRDVS